MAGRRGRLAILAALVVAALVGVVLVVGDRTPSTTATTSTTTVPASASAALLDLGTVPDEQAARQLLSTLDPSTLRPRTTSSSSTPTSSRSPSSTTLPAGDDLPLTEQRVRKCASAIGPQNVDRSLGAGLAAARVRVGRLERLVVSYALPASGSDPATRRILLVDATSCRVLLAVDD